MEPEAIQPDGDEDLDPEGLIYTLQLISRLLGSKGPRRKTSTVLLSDIQCNSVHQHPAVQRCCNLRNSILGETATPEARLSWDPEFIRLYEAYEDALGETPAGYEISKIAAMAYRAAMPDPISRRSVKAFIACILHGMVLNIIESDEGAKLLRGARAASLTFNRNHTRRSRLETSPHEANKPSTQADSVKEKYEISAN